MIAHLTFDEQPATGDAHPCECWIAGRYGGMTIAQVQHPDEFREGVQAAIDHDLDL